MFLPLRPHCLRLSDLPALSHELLHSETRVRLATLLSVRLARELAARLTQSTIFNNVSGPAHPARNEGEVIRPRRSAGNRANVSGDIR
jgi:hypothetical protein